MDFSSVSDGWIPFYVMCLTGNLPLVKLLLKNKYIDPFIPDDEGITPFQATKDEEIKNLIRNYQKPSPKYNNKNFLRACAVNDVEFVREILKESRKTTPNNV